VKPNQNFLSLPELSRIVLLPITRLKRELSRAGIKPDEVVVLGRGATPLFRRDRLPELLARLQSLLTTIK
jgi:hypothetical protein